MRAVADPLSAGELGQRVAAVVGVSASAEIADQPDAEVPEKSVEQEIARKRKAFPELCREQRTTARRIDCSGDVGAGRGENVDGPCRQRAVPCVVLCFKQQNAGDDTENDGPKSTCS